MKKLIAPSTLIFAAFVAFFVSCTSETRPPENTQESSPQPVEIESVTVKEEKGDCKEPLQENNCALVQLSYPAIKGGNEVLQTAVKAWALNFMLGLLEPTLEMDQEQTLEAAIQNFFLMHDESLKDFPESKQFYTVEVTDTVLLNNGKYLTLRLDGYSYAGGAHGNPTSGIGTFDAVTGQPVTVESLVTNLDSLQQRAEIKFREVRKEDFDAGFTFDQVFAFKLADNIGVLEEGLLFCYVPYEVGPYAMGYTEFVLSFEELKDLMK